MKEFIETNKGKFQIISADGFYQLENGEEVFNQFNSIFPGTVINMEFRTDDTLSYILKSEIADDDLF